VYAKRTAELSCRRGCLGTAFNLGMGTLGIFPGGSQTLATPAKNRTEIPGTPLSISHSGWNVPTKKGWVL